LLGKLTGLAIFVVSLWALLLMKNGDESTTSAKGRFARSTLPRANKKVIQLSDFIDGTFTPKSFGNTWLSGNEWSYQNDDGSIWKHNVETQTDSQLLAASAWESLTRPFAWSVSADQMFIYIHYNKTEGCIEPERTYSAAVFEVSSNNRTFIMFDEANNGIQKMKWSPVGHKLVIVRNYNVYVVQGLSSIPIRTDRLTIDGGPYVFNGLVDAVAGAEIEDDDALLYWSPDAQYLAFATMDDTSVSTMEMPVFQSLTDQYPYTCRFPYYKAGTNTPKTSITIVELIGNSLVPTEITPSAEILEWGDYYLNSGKWRNSETFTPTWKNRVANHSITEDCSALMNFTCTHSEKQVQSSSTGWIGNYKVHNVFPLPGADEYLTVADLSGYPHIQLVDLANNQVFWRTSGHFVVTDSGNGYSGYNAIHFYDSDHDWVYYTSTESVVDGKSVVASTSRFLWRAKAHGSMERECISCPINVDDQCNWVDTSFSTDGSYVVFNCKGSAQFNYVPVSLIYRRNAAGDYEFLEVNQDNAELQSMVDTEYSFRTQKLGTLQMHGTEWNYMLMLPENFDANKKYPLLVETYSGPGFQKVNNKFLSGGTHSASGNGFSWRDYVASSLDVVVLQFDGRGSGFRGSDVLHAVYKQLGVPEVQDQIQAAKLIIQQNSFIDPTRTAIWGWSYGGYMTTRAMEMDSEHVLKCGLAVAPVTDWRDYGAQYTERYMLTPQENQDGYLASSALTNVGDFGNHNYEVLHGTSDDNVHFQHAAKLNMFLVDEGVDYNAFYAADDDHSMNRVPNHFHTVYSHMTAKLKSCFKLP